MHRTTPRRERLLPVLVAGTCVLLASCGGGGDDPPAPTVASPAASTPAGAGATASTCSLPNFQASLLARINQVRASGADCGSDGVFGAAAPVTWNDRLTAAADAHAKDMSARNYFSHTSADGRTLADRVNATGYAWSGLGENIAAGYTSVNAVMDGWIASPGHCANLMNAGFSEMGVACVPGVAGDTYATYWSMELGRPR